MVAHRSGGEIDLVGNLFAGQAGGNQARQTLPFTLADSADPEDLWKYMANYEEKNGGSVLAIPHNGNLSNGLMFSVETYGGQPLSPELASLRASLEPVIEATQIKGDGEAHPFLSPDDEFADYETWDDSNLDGTEVKKPEMLQYEYARSALKTGLELEQKLGINPFKFGMVGSTDNHTALPTSREENNFSKASFVEPSAERAWPRNSTRTTITSTIASSNTLLTMVMERPTSSLRS